MIKNILKMPLGGGGIIPNDRNDKKQKKNLDEVKVKEVFDKIIEIKNLKDLKEIKNKTNNEIFQEALKRVFKLKLEKGEDFNLYFDFFSLDTKEEIKNEDKLIKENLSKYIHFSNLEEIKKLLSLIKNQKETQKVLVKAILENIKEGNYITHVLDLIDEKSLAVIKKNKKIIVNGLIKRLENGSEVSTYLSFLDLKDKERFKNKYKEKIFSALVIRLQEGGSISDLNELLTKDIVDLIEPDLLKKAIKINLTSFNKLEESYLIDILREKLELAIKFLINDLINKEEKIPDYILNFISQERIEEIFKERLIDFLKVDELNSFLGFKIYSEDFFKGKFLKYEYLLKDKKILDFLKEAVIYFLKNKINFSTQFLVFFDPKYVEEKIQEIKQDKNIQKILAERIKSLVRRNLIWYNPSYFILADLEVFKNSFKDGLLDIIKTAKNVNIGNFSRSSESREFYGNYGLMLEILNSIKENNQVLVKKAFLKRLKKGENLYFYLNYLLKEEELKKIKEKKGAQNLVKKGFVKRLERGLSLDDYFNLLNEKNQKEIEKELDNENNLRKYVKNSILNFFTSDLITKKEKIEIEEIIDDLLKNIKNKDFLKKALLDRTYLPLGLKIYLKKEDESFEKYFEPRAFKPESQLKGGYVTEVIANPYMFNLCFNVLEKILKNKNLENQVSFQACFPERLNNEMCGILTISFLFLREKMLNYTEDFLNRNQRNIALTIYDAGTFLTGEHVFFDKDRKPFNPYFTGRTDVLYCANLKDIYNALVIATLLFHASYPLKETIHKNLGIKFINDFKKILAKHNKLSWLENRFVDLNSELVDFEEVKNLAFTLLDITFERKENRVLKEEINKLIEIYDSLLILNNVNALNIDNKNLDINNDFYKDNLNNINLN